MEDQCPRQQKTRFLPIPVPEKKPGYNLALHRTIDELNKRTGCTRMSIEVKSRRWRFLGHVLRMPREHHCATVLTWTPMGKRKVGRPKTTWRQTVEKERAMAGWKSWEEARALAKDRDKRKKSSAALCATEREEDR